MDIPPDLDEQIATITSNIASLRNAFTLCDGEQKGQIAEPEVLREIQCLEATRRVLTWAKYHPAAAAIGHNLTPTERHELKGLEAACLESDPPSPEALWALTAREQRLGVYDGHSFSPRWQD